MPYRSCGPKLSRQQTRESWSLETARLMLGHPRSQGRCCFHQVQWIPCAAHCSWISMGTQRLQVTPHATDNPCPCSLEFLHSIIDTERQTYILWQQYRNRGVYFEEFVSINRRGTTSRNGIVDLSSMLQGLFIDGSKNKLSHEPGLILKLQPHTSLMGECSNIRKQTSGEIIPLKPEAMDNILQVANSTLHGQVTCLKKSPASSSVKTK